MSVACNPYFRQMHYCNIATVPAYSIALDMLQKPGG